MVREIKKQSRGESQLEELEKLTDSQVKKYKEEQDKYFKDELDTGFYFSVIFETKEERDKWLNKYNIVLMDNYSVKSKNFIDKIK